MLERWVSCTSRICWRVLWGNVLLFEGGMAAVLGWVFDAPALRGGEGRGGDYIIDWRVSRSHSILGRKAMGEWMIS